MPEYTYVVTQTVHYTDPIEFDSPGAVLSWIELGEWDRKHNEVKSQRVEVYDTTGTLVADSDADEGNQRPRTSCGCGYDLVWVTGQWQHDAAEAFWGGDHSTDGIDEPALNDAGRIEWDVEDGVCKLEDARAMELEDGSVYRDYGDDDWTLAATVTRHGDTMLIVTEDGTETSLDIDTVVERVIQS